MNGEGASTGEIAKLIQLNYKCRSFLWEVTDFPNQNTRDPYAIYSFPNLVLELILNSYYSYFLNLLYFVTAIKANSWAHGQVILFFYYSPIIENFQLAVSGIHTLIIFVKKIASGVFCHNWY